VIDSGSITKSLFKCESDAHFKRESAASAKSAKATRAPPHASDLAPEKEQT
jgi:hypothetical protein